MEFRGSVLVALLCISSCINAVNLSECGTALTAPGLLTSSRNTDNKWCKYTIGSDQGDYNVRLQFARKTALDVSTVTDECYGKVIIYDGTLSNVLGVYCYNTLPESVESTTNVIIMEYLEADLGPELADKYDFIVKYTRGSRANVNKKEQQASREQLQQGYSDNYIEPMNDEVDPCEEQNKEVDRLTGQRDALYISVIVFGSVGVVMVVMLSIAIHIISGREVKLRHYAGVDPTDPYLLDLKKEKKGGKSAEDEEAATHLTEGDGEGNQNKGFEDIEEGAVGGAEK
ncbi:uncharacterized protein [Ptychodera flava]|uniref:uncharacterized protein n=1 Tax=Ptychodera flava TaxID=63121 RepID=UPI00396A9800